MALIGLTLCLLIGSVTLALGCAPVGEECLLPTCQCPGTIIPGGLAANDTPQIVYLTFDDGINVINYPLYRDLIFDPNRLNPNGEPITATFYITHEYTDYNLTHDIWRRGNEIALHSITHQTNTQYWKELSPDGWYDEIVAQKQLMSHFANIDENTITGMRAPFLQTGGDKMMEVINGELGYDCSRPTLNYMNPGLWPYTMDYNRDFQDCVIQPCAVEQYKGFWNVPMVDLIGDDGNPCAMVDQCLPNPDTTEKVLDLLKRNFLRSYDGNRSPFGVFLHSAWLGEQFPGHKDGYAAFLDYLGGLEDVYIVSVQRAVEWFKNPTSLENLGDFDPWQVNQLENNCVARSCRFDPDDTPFGSERYMTTCQACPPRYPWLHNPLGDDL